MAKQQKSRAQSLRVNGKTVRISPKSDLDGATIKLLIEHVEAQVNRHGDDYMRGGFGWVNDPALAAAFKAKGFTQ